jgi:hypothetical protein
LWESLAVSGIFANAPCHCHPERRALQKIKYSIPMGAESKDPENADSNDAALREFFPNCDPIRRLHFYAFATNPALAIRRKNSL